MPAALRLLAIAAVLLALLATMETEPAAAQTPPPCPTRSATPTSDPRLTQDCNTLLELKDDLRGTATLNWARETALSSWDGVTSNAASGVTQLNLTGKSLTGTIPAGLGNLPNLTSLLLYENTLTGTIPTQLGDLASLQFLSLQKTD